MAALERTKSALAEQIAQLQPNRPAAAAATTTGVFDSAGMVNPRLANAVLIIEGDLTVGTGFVACVEGKSYLYTAAHVFSGNSKLVIKNSGGTVFKKFGDLEAADGADLIRIEILDEVKDGLEIAAANSALQINAAIVALGNGGGTGVVAVEKGKVLGTSADSLEVDAKIIQGNSGGPVVDVASGQALGVVTHLSSQRKDVWSEGARQAEVRRFACRLNKSWRWQPVKISVFLTEGKALAEFDEVTRLCFAMAQLNPLASGLRLDQKVGGDSSAIEILEKNKDNAVVRELIKMNTELGARKSPLSEAELKKKFRSLLSQVASQATRSSAAFAPRNFSWFHRSRSVVSVQARKESLAEINQRLDHLK